MAKNAHLRTVTAQAPRPVNGEVQTAAPPRRVPNSARRSREYLTPAEAERLIVAAGKLGRYGHRDATLLLIGYRHGLRVGELVTLKWDAVDLAHGNLHVNRPKHGVPTKHPLSGRELRALRRLQREYPETFYVFNTEREGPLTTSTVRKIVARAGEAAKIGFPVHPHMLRHAAGYYLANQSAWTPGASRRTSATETSPIRSGTPSYCPSGSRDSGRTSTSDANGLVFWGGQVPLG
jgi:type 1 fimbriae regulatory protein FimB/type 1 fimbriae regulatory protein FimE